MRSKYIVVKYKGMTQIYNKIPLCIRDFVLEKKKRMKIRKLIKINAVAK